MCPSRFSVAITSLHVSCRWRRGVLPRRGRWRARRGSAIFLAVAVLVQSLSVPFEYRLLFTEAAFDPDNRALLDAVVWREPERRHRALAIVDRGVADGDAELSARIAQYARRPEALLALAREPLVLPG